jgi:8-oxo-dGTP pyrophosphatase MutT (NUDIX family)
MAFRHPLAGCQLVKGSIENEEPSAAAVRELYEEAGVRALADSDLGLWDSGTLSMDTYGRSISVLRLHHCQKRGHIAARTTQDMSFTSSGTLL